MLQMSMVKSCKYLFFQKFLLFLKLKIAISIALCYYNNSALRGVELMQVSGCDLTAGLSTL